MTNPCCGHIPVHAALPISLCGDYLIKFQYPSLPGRLSCNLWNYVVSFLTHLSASADIDVPLWSCRIVVSTLFIELCVHIRFEGNAAEVLALMGLILEHAHFDAVQDGVSHKLTRGSFFKLSTTSQL
jgi:hypothetical protein